MYRRLRTPPDARAASSAIEERHLFVTRNVEDRGRPRQRGSQHLAERRKKWLIGIGGITVTVLAALSLAGYVLASRLEPYIRTQAIA